LGTVFFTDISSTSSMTGSSRYLSIVLDFDEIV